MKDNKENISEAKEKKAAEKNKAPSPAPYENNASDDRLFWFLFKAAVIAALTALVFLVIDMRVSAVIGGIFLIISGIVALTKIEITHKTWEVLLLPVIGFPMATISMYLLLSEHFPEKFPPPSGELKLLFWGVLALFMGLLLILATALTRARRKKHCTVEVCATCYDHVKFTSRGIDSFRAVWEYTFDGKVYREPDKSSSLKRTPERGHEQPIMIDPDDPTEFYRSNDMGHIMFIITGCGLLFAGVIIIGSLIKAM